MYNYYALKDRREKESQLFIEIICFQPLDVLS